MSRWDNLTICEKCGVGVTNLRKHLTRERCSDQHIRNKKWGKT